MFVPLSPIKNVWDVGEGWTGHGLRDLTVEQFKRMGYHGVCIGKKIQKIQAELGPGFWTRVNLISTHYPTAETMVLQPVI